MIAAQGLPANRSSGGKKNCVMYSLFSIFFVIIIICRNSSSSSGSSNSNSISNSFVVLLNCLYLNS